LFQSREELRDRQHRHALPIHFRSEHFVAFEIVISTDETLGTSDECCFEYDIVSRVSTKP